MFIFIFLFVNRDPAILFTSLLTVWSAKQALKAVSYRPHVFWGIDINPSGAEAGIVQEDQINITTAKRHGFYIEDNHPVFHGEGFEPPAPVSGILII